MVNYSVVTKMLLGYSVLGVFAGLVGLMIYFEEYMPIVGGIALATGGFILLSVIAWWIGDGFLGKDDYDSRDT